MSEPLKRKSTEPATAELEFIYESFARQLGDQDILEALQGKSFQPRSLVFIKRQRLEFEAAKKVLEGQIGGGANPLIMEAQIQHTKDLIGVSETIISGLEGIEFKAEDKYEVSAGKSLTRAQLVDNLIDNIEKASQEFRSLNRFKYFVIHFNNKVPENAGLQEYASQHPIALINLLRLIILKKDFRIGSCPICKDW
jgi:hypothetical protein